MGQSPFVRIRSHVGVPQRGPTPRLELEQVQVVEPAVVQAAESTMPREAVEDRGAIEKA